MSKVETNCYYTKTHEWIRLNGDTVEMGITDHAQDLLGDIVYLELPAEGDSVTKGKPLGVVESVKTLSDLYSPISGEVLETNDAVAGAPEMVNADAFGDGWLVRIKPSSLDADLKSLLSASDYQAHCDSEEH
ncbi:MAG: glycine cleavage system protein H [Deltaproteobacteria bacterium CG2_30_63_29]|nr:MAG: glycine cleavage system protein H [Deltaproteobacteria bacterium CG2_30_63_29]PJB46704.1 MAG: glycine cleavage system protein H [Deltaproteobacteria bacterium CG_4_9_14_3_um_filter_63_12]